MKKGDRVIYQNLGELCSFVYKIDDIDPDGNCIIETEEIFDMGITHQALVEFAQVRNLKLVEENHEINS